MNVVNDRYKGHTALSVDGSGWRLVEYTTRKALGQTKTPGSFIRALPSVWTSRASRQTVRMLATIGRAESIMHDEPRALLRQAILASLPHLQPLVGQSLTQYLVWRKLDDSRWHGEFQPRADMVKVFREARKQIKEASAAFCDSFPVRHPEYAGMVGFRGSQQNWANNHSHIVRSALWSLWRQHKTFDLSHAQVDAIVQEFADFVDNPTVRLRFQAQLVNFKMPAESLAFPGGLLIRRLSEEEVSTFHGGPIATLGFVRPRFSGPYEFVVEGELDEPKMLGKNYPQGERMADRAKSVLEKAVLCLRTFKEGHVGYDYIHFRPVTFCPIGFFPTVGYGDKYIPFGSYSLTTDEYEALMAHAKLIFACSEPAMEMACSRLADAENRTRPEDRIIDAVIGMEALLLAAIGPPKGELRFRFSLNYTMLFPPEEREHAYHVAHDLYDLRSRIVHGSSLDEDKVQIAGAKLALSKAGKRATDALRTIIMHFLPEKGAQYKNHEFWQRAYFGLPKPP